MRVAVWTLLAVLLLESQLLAQKCATCGGSEEVACPSCGGKGTVDLPCPVCLDRGAATCSTCDGKGRVLLGSRWLPCRVCVKGVPQCLLCKGARKVSRPCPVCQGQKKFSCPECRARAERCPTCQGTKQERCPICQGSKRVPCACAKCMGGGVLGCGACLGSGRVVCTDCGGRGRLTGAVGPVAVVQDCATCGGSGVLRCRKCDGSGTIACPDCKGKGIERGCWACGGLGSIPCRRCASAKAWSGVDAESGVTVVVLPVAELEPQVPAGMADAFPDLHTCLVRVVLDGRQAKGAFSLGGDDGWKLFSIEEGKWTPIGPPASAKEQANRYSDLLARCGVGGGAKLPLAASKGHAVTALLWKEGDPAAPLKDLRIRRGSGMEVDEVRLQEVSISGDDWLRFLLAVKR